MCPGSRLSFFSVVFSILKCEKLFKKLNLKIWRWIIGRGSFTWWASPGLRLAHCSAEALTVLIENALCCRTTERARLCSSKARHGAAAINGNAQLPWTENSAECILEWPKYDFFNPYSKLYYMFHIGSNRLLMLSKCVLWPQNMIKIF